MKTKKSKKADLNNYTSTFFLLGLVLTLFISWKLIDLKTYVEDVDIEACPAVGKKEDEIFTFKHEKIKEKIKKRKRETASLNIKKDDDKVKEDILKATDIGDDDPIKKADSIQVDDDPIPIDIPVDFKLVEEIPVYPGCEGKKGTALRKCMNDKIMRFVGKNFNKDLAGDLGLSGEKVKIYTQFTIDKDGKIVNVKSRSKYKALQEEAKRVVKMFPEMKPGRQHGMKVKVTYNLPIIFRVE